MPLNFVSIKENVTVLFKKIFVEFNGQLRFAVYNYMRLNN